MTAVSNNVCIDKLDDTVDKYNNTYHRKIKMKPVDVKSGNYIEYNVNSNDKDPKLQVGDNVRISKYKNIFAKDILQIGLKKFLGMKELKTLSYGHMPSVILMVKILLEYFMKKNCKK